MEYQTSNKDKIYCLSRLLQVHSFRSIFYFRLKNENLFIRATRKLCQFILPECTTIEIGGIIGGGFIISHNICIVYPNIAGKNLRIGPGVVIGNVKGKSPIIGDNVYIAANATVIGNIRIGNNVIIGAGSVVVSDIEDNSIVVGNPGRKIKDLSNKDIDEIM